MKNNGFKPKSLKIAYIGGGSRAWARTFMTDLALENELGGEIYLYDIDVKAAKDNEIIGNRISGGKWKYTASETPENALIDADFVIISILPGTFKEMRSDVHLPERLGIYQSVGDTAGPGGIIRALRTIPLFKGFAEKVRMICPDAWVINYTNPMALCLRALYAAFPEIKAFGCCHEVFGTQELLAEMIKRKLKLNVKDIKRDDINVNVLGLNHFTWFDRASWRNHDLFEMYGEFAAEHISSGFEHGNEKMPDKCFTSGNRGKFDLFRRFGLIAAAGDRHLAEFMPGGDYVNNHADWGFYLTSIDWREADLKRKLERSARLVSGSESMEMKPSGEEGIALIKALCGVKNIVSNVNLPNTAGQVENMPRETVAETNALFTFDSVRPLHAGKLPENINTLMEPHILNQTEVLNAALNCDTEAVYRVFERDPLIAGISSKDERRALARDMVFNTLKYLPEEWSGIK